MSTTTIPPKRMKCMEIWGGNTAVTDRFETVGIELYIQSEPFLDSRTGGGDIYYLTSCASGRITRMLLADVSGHGATASRLAVSLRDLMRENVNSISQQRFVEGMNREFAVSARNEAFATAVVATYFHPTRKLSIALAGHPNPVMFDRGLNRWQVVEPADDLGNRVGNLPLGVREDVDYPSGDMTVKPGDALLLFTDAFIEVLLKSGKLLGLKGLVDELNQIHSQSSGTLSLDDLIAKLRQRIREISDLQLTEDDATVIVARFTSEGTRIRDNVAAPFRLLGKVRDNTQLT